jgi:hypothetical protein
MGAQMMALPMTLNEAQARQWGRDFLVSMKEGPFEIGNGIKLDRGPLDPARLGARARLTEEICTDRSRLQQLEPPMFK